jgi:hypothetical protein
LFVVEKNEPFFSFNQCKNIHFPVHGHLLMPIIPVLPHGASSSLELGKTSIPCYRRSAPLSLLKILATGQTDDENVLYLGITVVMRTAFRIVRVSRPKGGEFSTPSTRLAVLECVGCTGAQEYV